jgi:hypothetical protein
LSHSVRLELLPGWFVLRHEIEHILNRDGLVTVDVELTESLQGKGEPPPEEVRANNAAAELAVPAARDTHGGLSPEYLSEARLRGISEMVSGSPRQMRIG